ncbi:MAG: hypothetical protein QM736_08455 [Vicinamibacterales bacterium]
MLEATFNPHSRLAEWEFQLIGQAAQLAGLVLEAERGRTPKPIVQSVKARRDGAAPLIGSARDVAPARAEEIERVAMTDFTVLLEGESGGSGRSSSRGRLTS